MRLSGCLSILLLSAGFANAGCMENLERISDPAKVQPICAIEGDLPYEVRERWIFDRYIALAEKGRIKGDIRIRRAVIVSPDGRSWQNSRTANAAVQRFAKRTGCDLDGTSNTKDGPTHITLLCRISSDR